MISLALTMIGLMIVIALLAAPLESLGWYAGWFGEADASAQGKTALAPAAPTLRLGARPATPDQHYLIYLSGIGAVSPTSIPTEELPFINALEASLPNTQIVADIFPYAPMNHGLTGQRVTARVWRWVEAMRLKDPNSKLAMVVNLRNLFQVLVSADPRYGPIANLGVARAIRDGLVAAGYHLGSGVPVTLLGNSGGGQMSLGAAYYLKPLLRAPIYVVSLGGVMCSDPGLERVEHLWHLYGEQDPVQGLGDKVFPGRWPLLKGSFWNQALAAGRITVSAIGPFKHNMKEHYYDAEARLPSGETYLERSVSAICAVLREAGLDTPATRGS